MQSSGQHGDRDFGQPTGSPNCHHQFFFLLQALVRLASFLSSKLKRDAALRVGLTGEFLIEEVVKFMFAHLRLLPCGKSSGRNIGCVVRVVSPPRWKRSTSRDKDLDEPKVVVGIELGSSTDKLGSHIKKQRLVYELRRRRHERQRRRYLSFRVATRVAPSYLRGHGSCPVRGGNRSSSSSFSKDCSVDLPKCSNVRSDKVCFHAIMWSASS